jgi:hypothetical protein
MYGRVLATVVATQALILGPLDLQYPQIRLANFGAADRGASRDLRMLLQRGGKRWWFVFGIHQSLHLAPWPNSGRFSSVSG